MTTHAILQRAIITSLAVLNFYLASATIYTFTGPPIGSSGNPLYENTNNWEGNNYPGLTIGVSDTVFINAYCIKQTSAVLTVHGYLEVQESFQGMNSIDHRSGTIVNHGNISLPVDSKGIVRGTGNFSAVLNCHGCSIYPGDVDQVGTLNINSLVIPNSGRIEVDAVSTDFHDQIIGSYISAYGDLVINYTPNSSPTITCDAFDIFHYGMSEAYLFEEIQIHPQSNLSAEIMAHGDLVVYNSYSGDRALHFDGNDDYASITKSLGEIKTIEFRFTPQQIGPTEAGQMLFHFNDELLQYIIINTTTVAFENETLTIKNEGGVGANSLYTKYNFIPGETYHVSIVANPGGYYDSIYVNGVGVESFKGTSFPPLYTLDQLIIGKRDNAFFYKGKMDEVRMWSEIRTPEEISDNATGYLSESDTSGLLLYYKFDQGIPYEDNTCLDFIYDEVHDEYAQLSNFDLWSTNISSWVYAGCRALNRPNYSNQSWGSDTWELDEKPNIYCHDVLIYPPNGLPFIISDTTHAACLSLEVIQDGPFIIESGGTLEVKGN